jgi:hypothetical protein
MFFILGKLDRTNQTINYLSQGYHETFGLISGRTVCDTAPSLVMYVTQSAAGAFGPDSGIYLADS